MDIHTVDPSTKKLVNEALSAAARAPEFVTKPKRQFIDEGETAKFKVTIDGPPDTKVTWSVAGKLVVPSDRIKVREFVEVVPHEIGFLCDRMMHIQIPITELKYLFYSNGYFEDNNTEIN